MDDYEKGKELAELSKNGYCVIPSVLDNAMLEQLKKRFSDASLSQTAQENFGDSGAFVVADYHGPTMVSLLTWPKTLAMLRVMGFNDPKLHNFYVSTKPPQAAALPWHSDLFYRYDESRPAELFLIYYLQDTSPQNGCLRVVPGSHRWPHDKRHSQPSNADKRQDEVDVQVKAGDLFIGDRRILHATHANTGKTWRTCLTIAYAPLYDELADSIKALIVQNRCLPPKGWWDKANPAIDPGLQNILPIYKGSAEPITIED